MNEKEMLNQLGSEMGTLRNTTHMAQYSFAISILEQIDEPELPVLPQFVANWIEEHDNLAPVSKIRVLWKGWHGRTLENELLDYFNNNAEDVMRAILNDGYTIEPEPVKTRQVLVKFFDNEEYKTELTEESAKELIEFLEANKHE